MIRRASRFPFPSIVTLLLASFLILSTTDATGNGAKFDPACSDPRAIAIADLALRAIGGRKSLERVRFLRFSFVLQRGEKEWTRRTHLWDRAGRRIRYESLADDGSPLVAIISLDSREGQVYQAGTQVDEPLASRLRVQAFEAWRNDAYWLLMPYRLKAPGVCLEYGEEEHEGNALYDRLYLTFKDPGLAPGERYRADFDRETHLLVLWSSAPLNERPAHTTTVWEWRDWRRQNDLLFSHEKFSFSDGESLRIHHPFLELRESVAEAEFLSRTPLSQDPSRADIPSSSAP